MIKIILATLAAAAFLVTSPATADTLVDFSVAGFGLQVDVASPADIDVAVHAEGVTLLCKVVGHVPKVGPVICPAAATPEED